ncbi:MAG: SCO6880 family protein [Corynebacterium sp.]|nr:SCO6880 family protein [Corynebacterium sp.]
MSAQERPTYTLGQPATRTGLGGLSRTTTHVLFAGLATFIVLSMLGLTKMAFFGAIPVTAIVAVITMIKRGGRNVAEMAQMVIQDLARNSAGENTYYSGPFSTVPGGLYRLPGILAATRLVEATDVQGQPVALIVDENFSDVTVVFDAQLSGQTAVTQDERNALTAGWGQWLASLSLPGDIRSASMTVSTRPSSGELVREEVSRLVVPDAPELARRILGEAADQLSAGLPEVSAHIAITIKVPREHLRGDRFVEAIMTRLSSFTEPLAWAGILARPMDEELLVSRVHAAFNPAAEADFEQIAVRSQKHGLAWTNCGPQCAEAQRGSYMHDGVWSRTWEMTQAPRSSFEDRLLTRLLAPHPRLTRKRVTLVYRPYEAGAGARLVEAEHQDALVAANSGRGAVSARAEVRLEMTQASRRAQARGAQLGRYSLYVTTTVDNPAKLASASQDIAQLAATSSLTLRPAYRQQDVAFATALGVGQVPWVRTSLMRGIQLTQVGLED